MKIVAPALGATVGAAVGYGLYKNAMANWEACYESSGATVAAADSCAQKSTIVRVARGKMYLAAGAFALLGGGVALLASSSK